MNLTYYHILTLSYLTAIAVWWLLLSMFPEIFLTKEECIIKRPWVQTSALLFCSVAVIFIGHAYSNGYLVPDFTIDSLKFGESINQILIYSPFPLFLIFSKQTLSSAWLSTEKITQRFVIGMCLSIISLVIFVLLSNQKSISNVVLNVFNIQNTHHAIQVFFEDFSIALLLSRMSSAFKPKYFVGAIATVSILFPLGHLPNDLNAGDPIFEVLTGLTIDGILVFMIAFFIYKSKDFLWFFPIHFAMDMMQFYSGLKL